MSKETSDDIASLAARVLSGGEATSAEIKQLAASCLSQAEADDRQIIIPSDGTPPEIPGWELIGVGRESEGKFWSYKRSGVTLGKSDFLQVRVPDATGDKRQ